MLNRMVNALMVLRHLDELTQQAYRALRRRDEATLLALKEELDEQVSRLNSGRAPRQAAGLAYQDVFKHAAAERLASFAVCAISIRPVGDQDGQNGKEKEALQEIVWVLGRTSVVPKGFPSFVRRGEGR